MTQRGDLLLRRPTTATSPDVQGSSPRRFVRPRAGGERRRWSGRPPPDRSRDIWAPARCAETTRLPAMASGNRFRGRRRKPTRRFPLLGVEPERAYCDPGALRWEYGAQVERKITDATDRWGIDATVGSRGWAAICAACLVGWEKPMRAGAEPFRPGASTDPVNHEIKNFERTP